MNQEEMSSNKKHGIIFSLIKGLSIFVLILAVIIGGIYFYVKYQIGIDLFKAKDVLTKMKSVPSESEMVSSPYDNAFSQTSFEKLLNSTNVYYEDDGKYIFSSTNFASSSLLGSEVVLSGKETASMLGVFLKETDKDFVFGSNEITLLDMSLSNLNSNTVDIKIIFSFDLTSLKNNLNEDILNQIIEKYLPDKIYFTSTFSVKIEEGTATIVENKGIIINKLSQEDSNQFISILALIVGNESSNDLISSINSNFINNTFNNSGFFHGFSSNTTISFIEISDDIFLKIIA